MDKLYVRHLKELVERSHSKNEFSPLWFFDYWGPISHRVSALILVSFDFSLNFKKIFLAKQILQYIKRTNECN